MSGMRDDGLVNHFFVAFIIIMMVLIPIGIWADLEEQREWDAFAADHQCKVVGRMSGSTQTDIGYGVTANGQFGTVVTTTSTPSKTGYLCDDGVTYWR